MKKKAKTRYGAYVCDCAWSGTSRLAKHRHYTHRLGREVFAPNPPGSATQFRELLFRASCPKTYRSEGHANPSAYTAENTLTRCPQTDVFGRDFGVGKTDDRSADLAIGGQRCWFQALPCANQFDCQESATFLTVLGLRDTINTLDDRDVYMPIRTRLEIAERLEEVMSHAYTELKERQHLEAETSLLKTYLLEAHSDKSAHGDIRALLRGAFGRQGLGEQSEAHIHETERIFSTALTLNGYEFGRILRGRI